MKRRALVLIVLLLATTFLLQEQGARVELTKNTDLQTAVADQIPGWKNKGIDPLSASVVQALFLDDYLNNVFVSQGRAVALYVGYYLSQGKIGAAHSPLVCFPGQGWSLSPVSTRAVRFHEAELQLASMIIHKGEEQQLVIYWFQGYLAASPGTFRQKFDLLSAKLLYGREDNAFVRVMVPIGEGGEQQAWQSGLEFIEAFYPVFQDYIRQG